MSPTLWAEVGWQGKGGHLGTDFLRMLRNVLSLEPSLVFSGSAGAGAGVESGTALAGADVAGASDEAIFQRQDPPRQQRSSSALSAAIGIVKSALGSGRFGSEGAVSYPQNVCV